MNNKITVKRLFGIISILMIFATVLSLTVNANGISVTQNPNTVIPKVTPGIDGNIDAADGYSVALDLSDTTCGHFWGHNPMTLRADLYYAYDDDGLYVAADITENLPAEDMSGNDVSDLNYFNYSTGLDKTDVGEDGTNHYGWNGDVMGIMVDPFGVLAAEGFNGQEDRSAWYMVGLFEADVARVYKSHTSTDGEITDKVKAAGKKTAEGWCFEVMIPWDMIIADTKDCSMGCVEITKDALVKEGTYLRVGAMYHDRFYDDEQEAVATWGRYIVVPENLPDGTPGVMGVGVNIASYGIELTLDEAPPPPPDPDPTTNTTTDPDPDPDPDPTKDETTDPDPVPGATNKPVTSEAAGTEAPQTLDMVLVLGMGALAVSGIGIVAYRKKR